MFNSLTNAVSLQEKVTQDLKSAIRNLSLLVLCVGFLGVGMLKVTAYPVIVESFHRWGYPIWLMYSIGCIEVSLGIALFYEPWRKKAIPVSVALMVGALATHIWASEWSQLYGPAVVLVFIALLAISQK